ncbi:MAG: hypothetical protein KA184_02565 [Candidatus Hydrogenedentes bacterium]|nr:hypothetical protein [Candidatus Hydrogenedentota bacterium]
MISCLLTCCLSLGFAAVIAGWPRNGAAQTPEPPSAAPFPEWHPDEQSAWVRERLMFWRRVRHLLRGRRTARTAEERAALGLELAQLTESLDQTHPDGA